jgi:hypothetical protein
MGLNDIDLDITLFGFQGQQYGEFGLQGRFYGLSFEFYLDGKIYNIYKH